MIKAIIFDFDGLILDTEYPEYQSWSEIFYEHGLSLPIDFWASAIGRGSFAEGRTPYDDLERQLGHSVDRAAVRVQRKNHFERLMQSETVLPGVVSLMSEARKSIVRLAVASSSPRSWVAGHLKRLGLYDNFDVLCCGDEVTNAKPAPDLYLAAVNALKISAVEAIALEDSPNGIASAKTAGIFCVAVPNRLTQHTSLAAADVQLESLEKLSLSAAAELIEGAAKLTINAGAES